MSRGLSTTKFKGIRLFIPILIAGVFLLGACKSDDEDDTSPQIDSDGDTLSDSTTGIKLPQSVQTIPAESTAARMQRLNGVKGGE